jgi:hypothetical protein
LGHMESWGLTAPDPALENRSRPTKPEGASRPIREESRTWGPSERETLCASYASSDRAAALAKKVVFFASVCGTQAYAYDGMSFPVAAAPSMPQTTPADPRR